jgi:Cu(I)/Ag(I) efflux system membrane fusion protein
MSDKPLTPMRIFLVRARFLMIFVVLGLLMANWDWIVQQAERLFKRSGPAAVSPFEYWCTMDPQVVQDEPGKCPICGMGLTQRKRGEKPKLGAGVVARLSLPPWRVQQAGVATSEIGYRTLVREVRTVGLLSLNEQRVRDVTARVDGRVEKLVVNYVGAPVRQGEPILELYSPSLMTTIAELRLAAGRNDPGAIDAARTRLRLWGLSDEQIGAFEKSAEPAERVPILSPVGGTVIAKNVLEGGWLHAGDRIFTAADLTSLWLQAELFERDLGLVREGQALEVTSEAYPGESFTGTISFVAPTVQEQTRTVKVRVEVQNPDGKLKPGMYVNTTLRVPLGRRGEVFWGC